MEFNGVKCKKFKKVIIKEYIEYNNYKGEVIEKEVEVFNGLNKNYKNYLKLKRINDLKNEINLLKYKYEKFEDDIDLLLLNDLKSRLKELLK